jgi:DNA replication protein DnaC
MKNSSTLTKEERDHYYELLDENNIIGGRLNHYRSMAERLMDQSKVTARFRDRTFDKFKRERAPEAYDKAKFLADNIENNDGEGLILLGNPGTGKTHLAASIINQVIKETYLPARFVGFNEFLEEIKAGFGTGADTVERLIDEPLLVIDDIGKEKKTEWSNAVLYRIVNARYEDKAPTIFTTNFTLSELEAHVDEAIFSRMMEMCETVKVVGDDYRMRRFR